MKESADDTNQLQSFFKLAVSAGVARRAFKVAIVVGTLLAVINHADAALNGTFAQKNIFQVLLSYFVPYAVATWSAVNALQDQASGKAD